MANLRRGGKGRGNFHETRQKTRTMSFPLFAVSYQNFISEMNYSISRIDEETFQLNAESMAESSPVEGCITRAKADVHCLSRVPLCDGT